MEKQEEIVLSLLRLTPVSWPTHHRSNQYPNYRVPHEFCFSVTHCRGQPSAFIDIKAQLFDLVPPQVQLGSERKPRPMR